MLTRGVRAWRNLATVSRNGHSEHALTDLFLQVLQSVLKKHNLQPLPVRWVPGHANIAGNESVDVEAKKAAEGETSRKELLPTTLRNPSTYSTTSLRLFRTTTHSSTQG